MCMEVKWKGKMFVCVVVGGFVYCLCVGSSEGLHLEPQPRGGLL